MQNNRYLSLLGLTTLLAMVLGGISLEGKLPNSVGQNPNSDSAVTAEMPQRGFFLSENTAQATATGGRSRGGSFSRPSSPSQPSAPSRSAPRDIYDPYPRQSYPRSYPAPGPVFIPTPGYYGGGGGGIGFFFVLLVLGGIGLPIIMNLMRLGAGGLQRSAGSGSGLGSGLGSSSELENDVVTVSTLQVALLAQARDLQHHLTELTAQADLSTSAGLAEMLRESVLGLLRSPENWTHVRATSQTARSREAASRLFEQLSLEERSKFSAETLVNIGGKVRRQAAPTSDNNDPASYIVVTLLIGTADDRPLFETIHSAEELKTTLKQIGSISPEYLMIYELLWSPQEESDSLTQDELIEAYPDLIRI
ncbi:MAG TPA: DUF1517 domain-containing protein [Trichocoleus sp.]|jgi:uncharacterized membrane protein